MDNPNLVQEAATSLCDGTVSLPRSRYDELICAERELGILRGAYQTMNGFTLDYIMDAIFDPKLKYKPREDGLDAE